MKPNLKVAGPRHQRGRTALALLALTTFLVALIAMLIPAGYVGGEPGFATALIGAALLTAVLVPLVSLLTRSGSPVTEPVAREPGESGETITDPLTRTLNKRGITIALLDLMALADRYGHRLSVAMLDVDHLRQVNETHGKKIGDAAVASLAAVLADALRMPDRVGRYTENEFLLVLPETELESACTLGERVRERTAEEAIEAGSGQIHTTVSVGVTEFRPGEDLENLVSRVEFALRQAKAKGRNSVVCTEAA